MFKKGKPKTGGKVKGTKNKATILLEDRREEAYKLVDKALNIIEEEMYSGDPNRKLKAIDKLHPILPFILPKLSNIDASVKNDMTISHIIFEDAKEDTD